MFKTLFLAHFWTIFSTFVAKFFSENSGSVTRNFIWVSSIMPKSRKNEWYIPRKRPDRLTDPILKDPSG